MNYIEIQFWKIARWLIIRGYGCDCGDFVEGCPACDAEKVVYWINGHISLLKS